MENQALLEGEFLKQNESEHPTLERTNSNSICNELSDDDHSFCCPPSTVEFERTFSRLGLIYKPKRFNLSEEHAKQQLFLYFNYGY
jgi:hypothetical protein